MKTISSCVHFCISYKEYVCVCVCVCILLSIKIQLVKCYGKVQTANGSSMLRVDPNRILETERNHKTNPNQSMLHTLPFALPCRWHSHDISVMI